MGKKHPQINLSWLIETSTSHEDYFDFFKLLLVHICLCLCLLLLNPFLCHLFNHSLYHLLLPIWILLITFLCLIWIISLHCNHFLLNHVLLNLVQIIFHGCYLLECNIIWVKFPLCKTTCNFIGTSLNSRVFSDYSFLHGFAAPYH